MDTPENLTPLEQWTKKEAKLEKILSSKKPVKYFVPSFASLDGSLNIRNVDFMNWLGNNILA